MRISKNLFKRRGGFKYFKIELTVQKKFLDLGFINKTQYFKNVLTRGVVRIIPNWLREKFYKLILR